MLNATKPTVKPVWTKTTKLAARKRSPVLVDFGSASRFTVLDMDQDPVENMGGARACSPHTDNNPTLDTVCGPEEGRDVFLGPGGPLAPVGADQGGPPRSDERILIGDWGNKNSPVYLVPDHYEVVTEGDRATAQTTRDPYRCPVPDDEDLDVPAPRSDTTVMETGQVVLPPALCCVPDDDDLEVLPHQTRGNEMSTGIDARDFRVCPVPDDGDLEVPLIDIAASLREVPRTQPKRKAKEASQKVRKRRKGKRPRTIGHSPLQSRKWGVAADEWVDRSPDRIDESQAPYVPMVFPTGYTTKKFRLPKTATVECDKAPQASRRETAQILDTVDRSDDAEVTVIGEVDDPRNHHTRITEGRWSIHLQRRPASQLVLSRVVTQAELSRHGGRIAGLGLCGYLSLEWASRVEASAGAEGLDLRDPGARTQLVAFLGTLLTGGRSEGVKDKIRRVQAHLVTSATPWTTAREDDLWLDAQDLINLRLPFPLVVWGLDQGDGRRRIIYPFNRCGTISGEEAREITRVVPQLVLDSAHYHPLDPLAVDSGAWVVAATGHPVGNTPRQDVAVGPRECSARPIPTVGGGPGVHPPGGPAAAGPCRGPTQLAPHGCAATSCNTPAPLELDAVGPESSTREGKRGRAEEEEDPLQGAGTKKAKACALGGRDDHEDRRRPRDVGDCAPPKESKKRCSEVVNAGLANVPEADPPD